VKVVSFLKRTIWDIKNRCVNGWRSTKMPPLKRLGKQVTSRAQRIGATKRDDLLT
jgi:hypothetical protein